jgi:hypothetical protein
VGEVSRNVGVGVNARVEWQIVVADAAQQKPLGIDRLVGLEK